MSKPWVLGISSSHNGSACLLHGNKIVCAIQEERIVREKRARVYTATHPRCVDYVLNVAGIELGDLDRIVYCAQGPGERGAFNQNPLVRLSGVSVLEIGHHLGHAISAYATSGFSESVVLVIDGCGSTNAEITWKEKENLVGCNGLPGNLSDRSEWASIYEFDGVEWKCLEKHTCARWMTPNKPNMAFFESLGGMYAAAGDMIFNEAMNGAGKLMGLAAYAKPMFGHECFFEIKDGQFHWSPELPTSVRRNFEGTWAALANDYARFAASTQHALEVGVRFFIRKAQELSQSKNFCFAGGVALNTICNNWIATKSGYESPYFVPAAEDSGTSIGAAYYGLWDITKKHEPYALLDDGMGKDYERTITRFDKRRMKKSSYDTAVHILKRGGAIGWFQGGSELGPRALGHRSILADPRNPRGPYDINKIKRREQYRPLSPAVLESKASEWFDLEGPSPFMLRSMPVKKDKRALIPAVVHVDGTARPQTVSPVNRGYYRLLCEWEKGTGIPILLNTSFNGPGEPIVDSPDDAIRCAREIGLDAVFFYSGTYPGEGVYCVRL